jgi:hypothetical protein
VKEIVDGISKGLVDHVTEVRGDTPFGERCVEAEGKEGTINEE